MGLVFLPLHSANNAFRDFFHTARQCPLHLGTRGRARLSGLRDGHPSFHRTLCWRLSSSRLARRLHLSLLGLGRRLLGRWAAGALSTSKNLLLGLGGRPLER